MSAVVGGLLAVTRAESVLWGVQEYGVKMQALEPPRAS